MIKDLRVKKDIELAELITKLKTQLLEIRFKVANGENKEPHTAREIKKTIAIAMTVLSERKAKLSYTAYQTRIIKLNKDGKQEFIPVKSSVNTKEFVKPTNLENSIPKDKIGLKQVKENNDANMSKISNIIHDDKNAIYTDAKKAKSKKVDMKKKPLQNRKISSKG